MTSVGVAAFLDGDNEGPLVGQIIAEPFWFPTNGGLMEERTGRLPFPFSLNLAAKSVQNLKRVCKIGGSIGCKLIETVQL